MDSIKTEADHLDASTWLLSKSHLERNAIMLENAWLTDITFIFPKEENKKIEAHKYVIATGSWYFFTLLGGNWGETNQTEINDVSSNAFNEVLKYLYTDTIEITPNNAIDLLHCSKYYGIPRLEEECNIFFKRKFNAETVLLIFENIILFDNKRQISLNEKCITFLEKMITSVLETEQFLNIQLSTLERILKIENLNCREYILFDAILKWATKTCEDNGISPCGLSRRQVLEHCVYLIRFPTMTHKEFIVCIEIYDSFLTKEEAHDIFFYITLKKLDVITTSFPTMPRVINKTKFLMFRRFDNTLIESAFKLYRGFDEISILTKKQNTRIHGIGIYGRTKASAKMKSVETVTVKLKLQNKLITEVVHRLVYDGSPFIYPMIFKEDIGMNVNVPYVISIERETSDDGYYYWGVDSTLSNCNKLISTIGLDFVISGTSASFSDKDEGDIPEIYYTKSVLKKLFNK